MKAKPDEDKKESAKKDTPEAEQPKEEVEQQSSKSVRPRCLLYNLDCCR